MTVRLLSLLPLRDYRNMGSATKHRRPSRGFTLLELMIVVLIIGIMSALAIPGFQLLAARARRAEMQIELQKLHVYFVNLYESQGNFCPPDLLATDCSSTTSFTSDAEPYNGAPIGQSSVWDTTRPGWLSIPFYPEGGVKMRYMFTANKDALTLAVYGAFAGFPALGGTVGTPPSSYSYYYQEVFAGVTLDPSKTIETPAL